MPGDDEQRVVDAHAEPDEHAEHGREVGDGHQMAEQHDARVGRAHGDQGGGDGQQAGGERAEGEEEDHGGDEDADALREMDGGGFGEGDGGAAQFDLEPVALGRLRGVDDGPGLGDGDLVGGAVEGDRGVGGAAVLADLAGARSPVRAGDRADARQFVDRVERAGHGLFDVGGADGGSGGVPDHGVGVAAEVGEAAREEFGGPAGLGAGDLVVVGVRGAREPGRSRGPAERGQPDENGDETVPDAPAGDGSQRTSSLRVRGPLPTDNAICP